MSRLFNQWPMVRCIAGRLGFIERHRTNVEHKSRTFTTINSCRVARSRDTEIAELGLPASFLDGKKQSREVGGNNTRKLSCCQSFRDCLVVTRCYHLFISHSFVGGASSQPTHSWFD